MSYGLFFFTAGRRIINPVCGSQFIGGSSGTRQFDDHVEPNYINFYAMSPNYFFGQNDNRKVRIARSSSGVGSLVICHSRSVVQPRCVFLPTLTIICPILYVVPVKCPFLLDCRINFTAIGVDEHAISCQTLAASGNVEIGLQNPCDGHVYIGSCPPLYVSVQSNTGGSAASTAVCTGKNDRKNCIVYNA